MKRAFPLLACVLGFVALEVSCRKAPAKSASAGVGRFVFENVNVVDLDAGEILESRVVVVRDSRIERLSTPKEFVPEPGDRRYDGHGGFLLPGLADMHVHVVNADDGVRFLQAGVTTIRNMSSYGGVTALLGFPNMVELGRDYEAGKEPGPRVVTAGQILDGKPPVTEYNLSIASPQEAREEVRRQKREGFHIVKLYDNLDAASFRAAIEEGHAQGMQVAGHAPLALSPRETLESGIDSLEHLSAFVDWRTRKTRVSPAEMRELALLSRTRGVWQCPTLSVWRALKRHEQGEPLKLGASTWRNGMFIENVSEGLRAGSGLSLTGLAEALDPQVRSLFEELWRAGAPLLAGTDTSLPGQLPGKALHDELAAFVESGLSPLETLRIATVKAAEFLKAGDRRGLVRAHFDADLILVRENPLKSLKNLDALEVVMVRGRAWTPRELGAKTGF